MALTRCGKILKLSGIVGVEDAEIIYAQWEQQLFNKVDLQGCDHLHSAVFQLIVVFQIPIHKLPKKTEFALWLDFSLYSNAGRQEA
ncbi:MULTISPECIES: hypothetical protein [Aeromonas]|uniref:hypothetical protein n=1 Tax=Aeromonas TaxID=642 RepID=UPI0013205E16|nr:hypothetical protein [Aeromonas veronii]MCJ8216256.1 hypothetical protein [Aeromonas veronii]MXV30948.1 hypothetical protein [Aeromonas veronii]HDZ8846994.1 hypothetical protein [Aeromonas veronii]